MPGWTREVRPFKVHSNACYKAWLEAGKPSNGDVFDQKQHSHAQYRHAIRRVKRGAKLQKAKCLFEAAMNGDIQLLKEMKNVTKGKGSQEEPTYELDGATGQSEVVSKFKQVYEELYNQSESTREMEALDLKISYLIMTRTQFRGSKET